MRMSKAVIVLTLSLTLAVPAIASPSDSSDHGSIITRVLKQLRRVILGEPSIPIPEVNH